MQELLFARLGMLKGKGYAVSEGGRFTGVFIAEGTHDSAFPIEQEMQVGIKATFVGSCYRGRSSRYYSAYVQIVRVDGPLAFFEKIDLPKKNKPNP